MPIPIKTESINQSLLMNKLQQTSCLNNTTPQNSSEFIPEIYHVNTKLQYEIVRVHTRNSHQAYQLISSISELLSPMPCEFIRHLFVTEGPNSPVLKVLRTFSFVEALERPCACWRYGDLESAPSQHYHAPLHVPPSKKKITS